MNIGSKRVAHLQSMLSKLNEHQDQDVVEHCGSCAERTATENADNIVAGEISVEPSQQDVSGMTQNPYKYT